MSDEQPTVGVIFHGERLPEKPKVRWYHWVGYYAYNFARKPKVWLWKREQNAIYKTVNESLSASLMPALLGYGLKCHACRNTYATLKQQVFLSSIKMILKNAECEEHGLIYRRYFEHYGYYFVRNEQLALKINGFKQ